MTDHVAALVHADQGWLQFAGPARIVQTFRMADVQSTIKSAETLARETESCAVGFVAYEAGGAFGLAVSTPERDLPLVWFALFPRAQVTSIAGPTAAGPYQLTKRVPSVGRGGFDRAFHRVKSAIADGDSYQVNYTFRMAASFLGDARTLFADLVEAQRGRYSAFLHIGPHTICSVSPELFFERRDGQLVARPMKGTARRGRWLMEDLQRREALRDSAKERAENVMIVDMVRNDLGRLARVGTVRVPELFTVERYPNVWQMTSLVTAESAAPLDEIFAAVHPSASVTGAPKVRTMEIIAALEQGPRGVYTGAIGLIEPDGSARFSVAIRTAVVRHEAGTVEFGIGSGIVWDSDASSEYQECLLKGSVLGQRTRPFELLETLRWTPAEGYFLLERHIARLRDSSEYFDRPFDEAAIRLALDEAVAGASAPRRVRLLAGPRGSVRTERHPLALPEKPARVRLAAVPVDETDQFLFHKTTNRSVYDQARGDLAGGTIDDVILWNRRREVTESTIANVVVELDGVKATPPLQCGLLAGTFRAELIASAQVTERVITVEDLARANGIWLVNSVQEWRRAVMDQ